MVKRKHRNTFKALLNEGGFTLLEAVVASMITAATIVVIMMFSMRTFEITSEINAINDVNHSLRRTQRAFVRDVQMAQYFFFGADMDNENNQIPKEFIDRRVLTLGYENEGGEMIWSRFAVRVGVETLAYYLLNTTNELEGGVSFETNILAPNVVDMYFTYFDENDEETTAADKIRRIEMTLEIGEEKISQQIEFSATLRGSNMGVAIPEKNLEAYESSNFVK